MDLHLPVQGEAIEEEMKVRKNSSEQLSSLRKELNALKKSIVMEGIASDDRQDAVKLACHTKLLEFGTHQINQIVDNAEFIFSIPTAMKCVDLWQRKHAVSVLKVFQSRCRSKGRGRGARAPPPPVFFLKSKKRPV